MKKTYSAPSIQIVKIQLQNLIASSEFNSNKGIVYGGVDKDGSMLLFFTNFNNSRNFSEGNKRNKVQGPLSSAECKCSLRFFRSSRLPEKFLPEKTYIPTLFCVMRLCVTPLWVCRFRCRQG